ncbi:MAG: MarR family winged helix-turn-helix transcriptional regulator [Pseudorhodoplanes sp.]|jgi:DNA-binding MarR family transcriptional regulator|nr:MarR family winged helix-turn-helix transcriptional regulator [Pseudorhodoplanes sp.]
MTEIHSDDPELHILESLITYKLTRIVDTIVRAASQVYRSRYNISITDLRILATIGAHSPLSANGVSRLTRIDKAWVSRSLASLAERGLVVRKVHEEDSRIILLALTPKGRALVRRMVPFAVARHEQLLAKINRPNRVLLNELLDILQNQADSLLSEPDHTSKSIFKGRAKRGVSKRSKRSKRYIDSF